jgi:AcrR family transcriptional regulator
MQMETKLDESTEAKIKEAARIVFTQKGYDSTKVRDIAKEADISVSLLNYYFRSKEKLFLLCMAENLQRLLAGDEPILNDKSTTILEKIEKLVILHMDMLLENPDFPTFVVNEMLSGSSDLPEIQQRIDVMANSVLAKQLVALKNEGKLEMYPMQLIMNVAGMMLFPFLAKPRLVKNCGINDMEFYQMIQERKKMIPLWFAQIIGS